MTARHHISRRAFVTDVGLLATAAPLAACAAQSQSRPQAPPSPSPRTASPLWDLSWIARLAPATDRAVFDWPSLGGADDPIVLQMAARYLDNCAVAYAAGTYQAIAVLNIRTTAIPAAINDAAWSRYALGAEYKVVDPATQATTLHNPFWSRGNPPSAGASAGPSAVASSTPTLQEFVQRGVIILVCDFAMGHLATRLAEKSGAQASVVHDDLLHSLVPGSYAVPSGIFGLARAQNAGCALVRV